MKTTRQVSLWLAALVVLSLVGVSLCVEKQTLVLLDDMEIQQTHSRFFKTLTDRGHQLKFSDVLDGDEQLSAYGDYLYDNLVIFAPTAEELGSKIKVEDVIAFIDQGGNVLVAASEGVAEPVRQIANECGIDYDEENTAVIDHLRFDSSDAGTHTLVLADNFVKSTVMLGKGPQAPVLFRGIGHHATENSRLITKVLTASDSAFSANPKGRVEEYPQSAGFDTLLVTALQARNNARAVFTGSLEMFSDKLFQSGVTSSVDGKKWKQSGNEALATEIAKWCFQERGLLRASNLTHHNQNGILNPLQYRVTDRIDFAITIEEFDGVESNTWKPFHADDVQLEFVMIDPYIRTALKSDGKGVFSTSLVLPDVYGVFKFRINYHKKGYSNIEVEQQVSVHPFRHNEFERFIDVAFPYYTSAFTVFVAFFIFGILFLYSS